MQDDIDADFDDDMLFNMEDIQLHNFAKFKVLEKFLY